MLEPVPTRRIALAEVRSHARDLAEAGARHGVSAIRVFGSVARNEADERSDLDLLVDVAPGTGLFGLSAFAYEAEQLLRVPVQVATVNGLKARMRDRVLAEAIPV